MDDSGQWDEDDLSDLLAPTTGPAEPVARPEPTVRPEPALGAAATRVPRLVSAPSETPPHGDVVVARPVARSALGAGRRFHPVPGAPLAVGGEPGEAFLSVVVGSRVHAVTTGRLSRSTADSVLLRTEPGLSLEYRGVRAAVAGDPGGLDARVPAGCVIGVVSGQAAGPSGGMASPGGRFGYLVLRGRDADGEPVDVAALLVGLTDPAELGLRAGEDDDSDVRNDPDSPVGTGLGIDPDELDRLITSGVSDPVGEAPSPQRTILSPQAFPATDVRRPAPVPSASRNERDEHDDEDAWSLLAPSVTEDGGQDR